MKRQRWTQKQKDELAAFEANNPYYHLYCEKRFSSAIEAYMHLIFEPCMVSHGFFDCEYIPNYTVIKSQGEKYSIHY